MIFTTKFRPLPEEKFNRLVTFLGSKGVTYVGAGVFAFESEEKAVSAAYWFAHLFDDAPEWKNNGLVWMSPDVAQGVELISDLGVQIEERDNHRRLFEFTMGGDSWGEEYFIYRYTPALFSGPEERQYEMHGIGGYNSHRAIFLFEGTLGQAEEWLREQMFLHGDRGMTLESISVREENPDDNTVFNILMDSWVVNDNDSELLDLEGEN